MGRRESAGWVFSEWEAICSEEGTLADGTRNPRPLALARALHARAYVDGRWTVDVKDAQLATIAAAKFEAESGEVATAERHLRALMAHPDFRAADDPWFDGWLAVLEIKRGAVGEGLARLRSLPVTDPVMKRRYVEMALRLLLRGPLALPEPFDPHVAAFVREFARGFEGMGAVVALSGGDQDSLQELLDATYGKPPV